MDYLPLSDNAARQLIDSATIFGEFTRVQAQAQQYAGGMYWKRQGDYEYLARRCRTTGSNALVRVRSRPKKSIGSSRRASANSKPGLPACERRSGTPSV